MPKVTWGGDISVEDIDNAETGTFTPYDGDIPPAGVYRFRLRTALRGKSEKGNPKVRWLWELDGSWDGRKTKGTNKKYDGCPLFDHMPVTSSSAFRTRAICDALGVSSRDFLTKTIVDEDQYITKIGKLAIEEGLLVFISVVQENDAEYGKRLKINGAGYLPINDDDVEDAAEEGDADDDGEGDPF